MADEKLVSVNDEKEGKDKKEGASANLLRHQSQCSICRSSCRQVIEEEFINWGSVSQMAKRYSNLTRDAVYRHAHALDLFSKRQKDIMMALGKIIEGADNMPMSGSQVVSAIKLFIKLTNAAQPTEKAQAPSAKTLFERMSKEEREVFARDGSVPEWFSMAKGATPADSQGGEKEGYITETNRVQ